MRSIAWSVFSYRIGPVRSPSKRVFWPDLRPCSFTTSLSRSSGQFSVLTRASIARDQMLFERLPNDLRTGSAPADEPHATADQPLDRRHPDLGFQASCDHLSLVQRQQDRPAHGLAPRFAAV